MNSGSSKKILFLTTLVFLLGLALALYSLYTHLLIEFGMFTGTAFCNVSKSVNCESVLKSSWSTVLGIPIASFGLVYYLIAATLSVMALRGSVRLTLYHRVLLVTSFLSVLYSAFLFLVSKFSVGAVCLICMSMYAVNVLSFVFIYVLGRAESLFSRLQAGLGSLCKFPAFLFSTQSKGFRLLVGVLCLFAIVSFLAPTFLLKVAAMRNVQLLNQNPVQAWLDAPVQEIPLVEDGAYRDFAKGQQDAPVQLIEFLDFQCPFCRNFYFGLSDVVTQYPESVRVVYKNYPLDSSCNEGIKGEFHHLACELAEFTRCAGEQGKFWEAVRYVMFLEEVEQGASLEDIRQRLSEASDGLGLDGQAVEECRESNRQIQKIKEDIAQGDELGLTGTPSIWINGRKVSTYRYDELRQIIEKAETGG